MRLQLLGLVLIAAMPVHSGLCASPAVPQIQAGEQQFPYEGLKFFLSVPKECLDKPGCGLIVDIHGYLMTAEMEDLGTRLRSLAPAARNRGAASPFVLLQPQAAGNPPQWKSSNVGTVHDVLNQVRTRLRLDPDRVHAGGFSQGGWMTAMLYCAYPGELASAAFISGGASLLESCVSDVAQHATPSFLYMHNPKDSISAIGHAVRLATTARDRFAPGREPFDLKRTPKIDIQSGAQMYQFVFHDREGGFTGAHCIPGGTGPVGCEADWNAGQMILDFYIAHPRRSYGGRAAIAAKGSPDNE